MSRRSFAFVHCWIKPGGALNVLEDRIQQTMKDHPRASYQIFTLYADRPSLQVQGQNIIIQTVLPSWLNTLLCWGDRHQNKWIHRILDYRCMMPFFVILTQIMSRKLVKRQQSQQHEVVVRVSSFAVSKNITVDSGTRIELYLHQPMYYIWDLYQEYYESFGTMIRIVYRFSARYLRKWDSKPRSYHRVWANSEYTKQRACIIYKMESSQIVVRYPPLTSALFTHPLVTRRLPYLLSISRLTKLFKHVDVVIHLCNRYQVPLLIAGDGPDKQYLQELAGPTVTFVGWVSDISHKMQLISESRGVLAIAHESFGIVTAESLLLGTPVFGSQSGATPELLDTSSGVLTPSLDPVDLYPSFEQFLATSFDYEMIQQRARHLFARENKMKS